MSFGIQNATNTSLDFINSIANTTGSADLMVSINNDIYGGWLYFVMLFVLWIILYFSANQFNDQPLNNAMYSGAIVSVISIMLRGVEILQNGVLRGLLTDFQMWIFPVITVFIAALIWSLKD